MTKNTGKSYESLTEAVFSELLKQDSVENIKIEKNKILTGKSTTHEIDVYWQFRVGDIVYETIIQAKDWNSKVPQGEILKLKAILEDLPSQPRGIFVTKTGFQAGAIKVAKANGILLYELREPTEKDWEGRLKTIIIDIHATIPDGKIEIVPDNIWLNKELLKRGLDKKEIRIMGLENEIIIFNEDGKKWKNLYEIKSEELDKIQAGEKNKEVTIDLNVPKYIKTNDEAFPLIKLKEIKLILSKVTITQSMKLDGSTMVGYILKNILDGTEKIFDKNLKLK